MPTRLGGMQLERADQIRDVPVVIAYSGWNDAGNAASDAVLYLIEKYPSRVIAEIDDERYYDYLATRPNLRRSPDGPWMQWPRTAIHHIEAPGQDLVAVIGPEPSLLWRTYVTELISHLDEVSPRIVVLLGALLSDTPHSRPLPVTMSSYDALLQQDYDIEPSTYEGPSGIVGVTSQALAASNIPTASLWVSIPHYVATPPNPKGQHALLSRLEEILGISLNLDDLPEEAEKWTRAVDELSSEDPDVAEYIGQLEEAKDASDVEDATGDTIAREFERYLKGRGKHD